jgi:hypothetical protein
MMRHMAPGGDENGTVATDSGEGGCIEHSLVYRKKGEGETVLAGPEMR